MSNNPESFHRLRCPQTLNLSDIAIPIFPDDKRVAMPIRKLRKESGTHIINAIQHPALSGMTFKEISLIGVTESVRSACFLLGAEDTQHSVVIKLTDSDPSLDVFALKSWTAAGITTPTVIAHGPTEATEGIVGNAYFTAMTLLTRKDGGGKALDGYPYLDDNNNKASVENYGKSAGGIANQIATCQAKEGFFGGRDFEVAQSFPSMIDQYIRQNSQLISKLGIDRTAINSYLRRLFRYRFPVVSTIAHNDFGPHNLLVTNHATQELGLIDPNAIAADAYWDIATAANRLDWLTLQLAGDPNNEAYIYKHNRDSWYYGGLIEGFSAGQSEPDQERLHLVKIAQAIWKVCRTEQDQIDSLAATNKEIHNLRIKSLQKLINKEY